jgi:hypothetical protein
MRDRKLVLAGGGECNLAIMPGLPDALVWWVLQVVDEGATVSEVRGLRDGSSPWLVRLASGDEERRVVLPCRRPP